MCSWYISAYVSPKQKLYLDMTQQYNISQRKSNKKRTIASKHHLHYKKIQWRFYYQNKMINISLQNAHIICTVSILVLYKWLFITILRTFAFQALNSSFTSEIYANRFHHSSIKKLEKFLKRVKQSKLSQIMKKVAQE